MAIQEPKKKKMQLNQQALNDVVIEQFKHILYHRPNKNILRLADDFLRCSREDLIVCKLLYEHKQYSYSTYFLQQCAEKVSKAYVLYFGRFTKNDIFTISHNSLKAFLLLLERMSPLVVKIHNLYPDIQTDTTDIYKLIKDPKKRLEMAKITYENFQSIFKFYENYKKEMSLKFESFSGLLENLDFAELLKNFSKALSIDISKELNGKDSSQILKEYSKPEKITKSFLESIDFMLLYLIAAYTYVHEEFTRYPDKEIKPWDYTEDLGIVKATPELIIHLERIIKEMSKDFS